MGAEVGRREPGWKVRATVLTATVGLSYGAITACSSRPSSWPPRTATPIQAGMVTPVSNYTYFGSNPDCGPVNSNSNCPPMPVLPLCCPVGRCINTPFEPKAGSARPHFCWESIPQAFEYTIVVQDMSPTPRVVWAWTFAYSNPAKYVLGVEYDNSCGTVVPTGVPLGAGGPYATPTQVVTATPGGPAPDTPTPYAQFRWGVAARIDNQYFSLGGPWEFVAFP